MTINSSTSVPSAGMIQQPQLTQAQREAIILHRIAGLNRSTLERQFRNDNYGVGQAAEARPILSDPNSVTLAYVQTRGGSNPNAETIPNTVGISNTVAGLAATIPVGMETPAANLAATRRIT